MNEWMIVAGLAMMLSAALLDDGRAKSAFGLGFFLGGEALVLIGIFTNG